MSMVVFPFRAEEPEVVTGNLAVAAGHARVARVLAVGTGEGATFDAVERAAPGLSRTHGTTVEVRAQERIGTRRPGKGDGMNTGLRLFLASGEERLHFYDADITNFDGSWIEGAEAAADAGYPIVRHYFPRASTDAMITWLITRPGFAATHPDTILWRIEQPLGGEFLVTRPVVESLASDPLVSDRSDWGVDTALTHAMVATGSPVYEHFVPGGKQHALYGSLAEIRTMAVECFEAILDLSDHPVSGLTEHVVEPEEPATDAIAHKVAYDVEATIHLLIDEWSPGEVEAAAALPDEIGRAILSNLVRPTFSFMDAAAWRATYAALLESYRPEPGWRALLFRLWVARVLAYTTSDALAGHSRAMELLRAAVAEQAREASS